MELSHNSLITVAQRVLIHPTLPSNSKKMIEKKKKNQLNSTSRTNTAVLSIPKKNDCSSPRDYTTNVAFLIREDMLTIFLTCLALQAAIYIGMVDSLRLQACCLASYTTFQPLGKKIIMSQRIITSRTRVGIKIRIVEPNTFQ